MARLLGELFITVVSTVAILWCVGALLSGAERLEILASRIVSKARSRKP